MTLLSPAWLALFAPFAALVWHALRGTPTTRPTTSAFLWPATSIASSSRARRVPPAWTIAALIAIAASIVALAGPARRDRPRVVVVVDPSCRVAPGVASRTWSNVERAGVAPTLVVPGQPDAATIAGVRPTARSTGDDVAAAVAWQRRENRDVIVVTEAPIATDDHVRVVASSRVPNASIERIGARSNGAGVDVFVRIERTNGSSGKATLAVRSGGAADSKPIEWSGEARSVDAFVHLSRATDAIEASVTMPGDAIALDDVARLTLDAAVRVKIDGAVPSSLERFAAAFARVHSIDGSSTDVTLTRDTRIGNRVVIVADGASIGPGATRRDDHTILADVDLDALPATDAAMPAGFSAIAWRGERPIVATRDVVGRRAAWLAIDATAAARDAAFVVLLDQAIAWTSGSDGAAWTSVTSDAVPRVGWRATHVGDVGVEASPGAYVDADGRPRAVNLPATAAPSGGVDDVELAAWLASRDDRATRSTTASPGAIAAGFAAIAAALSVVSRRRPANLDVRAVAT